LHKDSDIITCQSLIVTDILIEILFDDTFSGLTKFYTANLIIFFIGLIHLLSIIEYANFMQNLSA
jgi:hypothetical protein